MAKASNSAVPTRTTAHKTSIGEELDDVVRTLVRVLGTKVVAAVVKKDVKTVQRWLAKKSVISMNDERTIRDTFQIYTILAENDGDHTIRAWFMGMNPTLNDHSPLEVLIEGRPRNVVAAARAFANGG